MRKEEITKEKIIELYEQDFSLKEIAEIFGLSRAQFRTIWDKFGIRVLKGMIKSRICNVCSERKSIDNFRKRMRCDGTIENHEAYCKTCERERNINTRKSRYENYKKKNNIIVRKKLTPEEKLEARRKYYREYTKKRKEIDVLYKLKMNISSLMLYYIDFDRDNSSKIKHLPYTIAELKAHLESQFEDWMSWSNYGKYFKNGPMTWQIDHIIPQSKLPYTSLEDENFKKCWALENLRPLESLANIQKSNK